MILSGVKIIAGILIFAGLPLLGWGVTDARGFLGHPARLAYTLLVVLLQCLTVIRYPGVGRSGGGGRIIVRRQRWAVLLLQVLSAAVAVAAPWGDRRGIAVLGDFPGLRFFGLAAFTSGFILMQLAEAALGGQFSLQVAIQEGHRLVTAGPYRHVRHPRYLGLLGTFAGMSLVFRSGAGLALAAGMLPVLAWRIRDEEELMRREFGEEWEAYARGSWRLLPFVY